MYNAPVDYVNLLLHGGTWEYLKNVSDYHPLEPPFVIDFCQIPESILRMTLDTAI